MFLGAFAALLDLQPDITVMATAGTGDEALAAVERHRPHILLTDIEMPGRTGLEVAAERFTTSRRSFPGVAYTCSRRCFGHSRCSTKKFRMTILRDRLHPSPESVL
ncbi:response regulator [Saccharopolyspora sp. ASAGF58]|uniref:response regulator n=1 Tax=Saccharopolyspora sp. ASAGF58 TaxID=2719023 RepID=UPI002113647B|nr:response regulator [Saccharopolyspora sp. ASAGF58]